ncbi:MAG: hypothetical protein AAGU27_22025 [Dehalobacterium sp.]
MLKNRVTSNKLITRCQAPVVNLLVISVILAILPLIPVFPQRVWAQPEKKVVMVLVDYITMEDIKETPMPNLKRMIRDGGLSLINTNTGGGRVRSHSPVTIGAGRVALGSNDTGLAFLVDEKYENQLAEEIFRRRTGQEAQPENMVHLGIAEIRRNNEEITSSGEPGLLGETLHQAGLKTAVIGEADLRSGRGEEYGRQAATIAMDRSGVVDYGFLGDDMIKSRAGNLLSLSKDYQKMGETLTLALEKADLIVVETGDTVRLMNQQEDALDQVFEESKKEILQEIDLFLADVVHRVEDYEALVLVVVPTPSRDGIRERNWVTPLICWKEGGPSGYLTSGTTRREGIVANTDIAPTVLDFFDLPVPPAMSGRPVSIIPVHPETKTTGGTLETLLELNKELIFVNKYRPPLVKGYVLGQIIVVLAAVLSLFTSGKNSKIMQPVLLALASVPLTFLLLGAYPGPSIAWYLVLGLISTGFITGLSLVTVYYHRLAPFFIVSLLTAGAIFVDLLLGAPLMKYSVLGYDPMGGARYYGLGNEYMGVWIGSAITAMASLMQITRAKNISLWFASVFYLLIIFMLASPQIGTNAGGSITALVGFGIIIYLMLPFRITYKQFAFAGGVLLCFLMSFAMWDAAQTVGAQSHFGRTINLMRTNGISEAYNIIVRKIAMNIKLIRWTIWSQVFLVTLAATAFLFYRPIGVMKRVGEKYPFLTKGFWGVVAASMVALVFNDSGIVAAATMSIFAAAPLIFVVIEEQKRAGIIICDRP